jgi:glycosyltransferase involved in cell wall biosynthesis
MIEFKIVVPCYNVEKWVSKTIASIKEQTYTNFVCLLVDDMSDDSTVDVILQNIKDDQRFSLEINKEKKYPLKNFYDGFKIIGTNDEDVYVNVDGDDWLASNDVLEKLNEIYTKEKCLMTYGSFVEYPSGITHPYFLVPYDKLIIDNKFFREVAWKASHLRTYKAKLFNKIRVEDFIDEKTGKFFETTADLAFMFPMLEMAGSRSRHIQDILYVYNKQNPISEMYVKVEKQLQVAEQIKRKEKYNTVEFE